MSNPKHTEVGHVLEKTFVTCTYCIKGVYYIKDNENEYELEELTFRLLP